ncbi:MAG: hypothetical protein CL840_06030 [Crocinitomicaceae bacterium]|nr:hypothetical protein [Crocinitomicaceae bacterium]|tara:strand:+ start:7809 stop:8684 length:876 start_codon:yes stop_codon:yes gene_type:complete
MSCKVKGPIINAVILVWMAIGLFSCNWFKTGNSNETGEPVIRVFDKYLYDSDLSAVIPEGTDSIDSTILVSNYVNTWIETQLMLHRAELNLNEDQKNFDKKLSDYKNNLTIYTYEQALIQQKLDTNVSNIEIQKYYTDNSQNFELKDYVVKARWLKVAKEAPKLKKIRKIVTSQEDEDVKTLEDYCYQFASSCLLEDTWLYLDEFYESIPLKTNNIEGFLKNNKSFEVESEQFIYLVYIKDYKLKEAVSPLELEKEKIKSIILNKRKLQLLSSIREGLLEEGISKNNVQYY